MRAYLMARYSRHPEMRAVAQGLQAMGHDVTSRWIWGEHQASDTAIGTGTLGDFERRLAEEDIADLRAAEVCIGFSEPLRTATRGGRCVELGMALALHKRIIVVGGHEHVFHALPQCEHINNVRELFALMLTCGNSEEGGTHSVLPREYRRL